MTVPALVRPARLTSSTRRWAPWKIRALGAVVAALPALVAPPASAQMGVSASVASDYRYRGYSLTAERPAITANLSYDHASGAYAAVTAIAAATRRDGLKAAGYQAYVGYAGRFNANSSWEVGASRTNVTEYYRPSYKVPYSELYVGVSTPRMSAHLYYSPNYLGEHAETVYATVNASLIPATDWRVFGHVGALAVVKRKPGSEIRRDQYDVSVGVARRIGDLELQLTAGHSGPDDDLVASEPQSRSTLVASATYFF